ncbi:PREDICTED: interphotoreceptor matrix proteoglycan 1 [Gavialis gangeticus]|uniref:interphotoreceptor matrix proteoglycan 1 n=1 Tax=Gavialis gangeticus TaxID=94835 RepID=UPI00092EF8D5|nr:PREDICTED: interphotoreceptor matrix proteoglycan 1 [Gavialis gangeticus]
MRLKTGLIFLVICLALQVQGSKEISHDEAKHLADASEKTTKRSRESTIRKIFDMTKHRTKRSSLLPTGVKVCPQESVKQILASHQAYYRLRVCQEVVWEAFRIFLDRIPDASEYQNWVGACQRETFCIFDIGKNFSNSQAHLEIIQRRVKHRTLQERKDEISPEKTGSKKLEDISSLSTDALITSAPPYASVPIGTLHNEIVNDTKTLVKELKPEVTNTVPELPVEQTVEFSITLTNQEYTTELSDPRSPQYQDLAAKFQLQMQKIFEKLPGFKEIHVLGFKQKKEKDGSSSTIARYIVNFEKESSEVKGSGRDLPTIGSNKVESGKNLLTTKEQEKIAPIKLTITDLQKLVAMALQDDKSLPMDLGTLQFIDGDPSPATVDRIGVSLVIEYSTGTPMLSGAITVPEDFGNFISPKPIFSTELSKPKPFTEQDIEDINVITDQHSFTVPFSILDSTDSPVKPEDSVLLPPADESASSDLSPEESELPTVQVITLAAYTPPNFLQDSDQKSEAETKKDQTVSAESTHKEGDQDLFGQVSAAIKIADQLESSGDDILATASTYIHTETLPFFTGSSDVSASLPEDIVVGTAHSEQIVLLPVVTSSSHSHSVTVDQPFRVSTSSVPIADISTGFETEVQDIATELDRMDAMGTSTPEEVEYDSGYISVSKPQPEEVTPVPTLKYVTTSFMTTATKGKELVVFFSLRVTNMPFSDDLFNRSSPEYKALEQQFIQLLLPYLQANLTGFKQLEILNFRNGSVIVNSKMKFARSVPYNITEAVHCVLEDFCDAAAQRLNLEIDSYSLDIEPADQADPCKFMACDEFSECITNERTKEADCLCKPGYKSQDGLPCQSLCEIEPHLCINSGKCELVPGKGAVCRCPIPSSCNSENAVRLNPAFEHDEPIASVCHMPCIASACVNSAEIIDQGTLHTRENTAQGEGHQIIIQNQD